MVRVGDSVPDFDVQTIEGLRVKYDALWQRRNLLLAAIPRENTDARRCYIRSLSARMSDLTAHETACVITSDAVPDLDAPSVVIADRWGEIHHVATARSIEELPDAEELIEWLRWIQYQCPECHGESR